MEFRSFLHKFQPKELTIALKEAKFYYWKLNKCHMSDIICQKLYVLSADSAKAVMNGNPKYKTNSSFALYVFEMPKLQNAMPRFYYAH